MKRTRDEQHARIEELLPDGGRNTAAVVRELLHDLIDSAAHVDEDTHAGQAVSSGLPGRVTPTAGG